MKKAISLILALAMSAMVLTGCSGNSDNSGDNNSQQAGFSGSITVITRESGSGTRGAFVELTGVERKDENGNKVDHTTVEAVTAAKTDAVLTNVSGNDKAIGYISMGSMNGTVKALKINGAEATPENVKNGSYKIARPFNIATKGEGSEVVQDFIKFILSKQGQEIVSGKYITVNDAAEEYTASNLSGKITVSGSSSVSPLMEELIEAYIALVPGVTVELQTSDSTKGMNDAKDGICDIGMASRELKDSEKAELTGTVIAMDGIAVIVNNANPVEDLTVDQVKDIYTGTTVEWDSLVG